VLLKKVVDAMKDLCKDVNFDCSEKGLSVQSMDSSHVALVSLLLRESAFTDFIPNDVTDANGYDMQEHIDHMLHRIATLCKSRGLVFKLQFQGFDRNNSATPAMINPRRAGKCSVNQFKRCFPFKKEFNDDEVDLLVRRYMMPSQMDINFQAIHDDVSEVMTSEPPPFPTSPLYLKPDAATWEHQALNPVRKIQSKVVERRVRIADAFKDFDILRKGFCTPGQFKTVLAVLNLAREIDTNDFNDIVTAYSREDGMFCYSLFVSDIDSAFMRRGLENDPMAVTPMPDASSTAPGRRNRQALNARQREKFNKVEDRLRAKIRSQRILMKPMFLDMDRRRKGVVSKSQFQRVMGQLGWPPGDLTPQDVEILALVYCDRGNHSDFNYVDFIKACDTPVEAEELAVAQMNAPYKDPMPSKYFLNGKKVKPLDAWL